MEVLRRASLLLPTGPDGSHAGHLRCSEPDLVELQIQVQVCFIMISDLQFIGVSRSSNCNLPSLFPSGRTERQQMKEVLAQQRAPPPFTRTPSRRQPRRMVDEQPEEKMFDAPKYIQQEIKSVSIPQPAQTLVPLHRKKPFSKWR